MKGQLLDAIPLTTLHGVGAGQAGKLAGIGLHTLQDLLFHLPLRYEDQTWLYTITDLLPGIYATVSGEVLRTDVVFGRKRMMTCQISDGTGILTLRFFNFSAAMKNALVAGKQVTAYGEIRRGKNGPEIFHPEYKVRQSDTSVELQETLTPIYPTTEGVRQATLRKLLDQALELLDTCAINELLPPELTRSMMSLPQAENAAPATDGYTACRTGKRAASGTETDCAGRTAGASPQHAGGQSRGTALSRTAAVTAGNTEKSVSGTTSLLTNQCPAARGGGNRAGSGKTGTDDAPDSGGCRLRENAGRRAGGTSRYRTRQTGGADGTDRIAG